MTILVTGASGLLGSALCLFLQAHGHRVIPLHRAGKRPALGQPCWDAGRGLFEPGEAGPAEAVIHLAGENIARRWTAEARSRIRESRVQGTRFLAEALARLPVPPRVLLCASAVGYYGDRAGEILNEDSGPGQGFLAETCQAWEAAARPAVQGGVRVVHLRLGIVLASQGGALRKMLPAFRCGLGGRLGSGRQYWSWISLEDVLRAFAHALATESLRGPVNAVAPGAVTNTEFTRALAAVLGRRPFLPVPAWAVSLGFGQMGRETLLASACVQPQRLLQSGFTFQHPRLEQALRAVLWPARD